MARLLSRDRTRSRTRKQRRLVKRISLLVAGTLTAGLISTVPAAAADTPAVPAAPIALASVAATGDDQLFALAADHSAVYRWSGHGTEWAKIGGPAQDLYAGGAGLFATSRGSGQLNKYNGQPDSWSQIGGAGADFAVTGDHLYGLNPERTAVYEWTGTGTDWTKIGGPAQDLEAGGAGLFATSPDGKLHKYNGQPDTWSEIGGAGADFAVTGDHLYGLNPERTAVYEWTGTGTDWTKVGGAAQDLHAGGAGLFATSPDKKIHRYSGQPEQWGQVGEAGKAFTVGGSHLYGLAPDGNSVHRWSGQGTDWTALGAPSSPVSPPAPPQPTEQAPPPAAPEPADENPAADEDGPRDEDPEPAEGGDAALTMAVTAKDDLYTLTPDHSALWRRSGSRWEQISGPAGSVYAGRAGVFITRPDTNKQISKYNDKARTWEPIGEANGSFAITGDHLYHLTPDGIGQWDGDDWTGIGGPAKNIYAGGAGLFATNPDTGHIYQYGGTPNHWTEIGGPGATFASGHDRLYAIAPDHSAVYEWTGNGTDWTRIGGPAKNIYAGGAGLFATNPDTGHIYQYGGTPDRWTEIGGPGATFTVSDTQLYGLTPDRSATYRWDGKANWTRIGGPENTAQREADERLLRENCQPVGRDCVKELRDAEKILETSLTDWLKDNSLDFLLDTFSINDIRKCAADTDLNSCLTVLLDAGSVILGIGALKKAKNTFNKAKGLHEFADKAKKARDTYNDLRKIINTARKAKEKLPKEEEQQRQEPCPVSKGSTSATASAYTAVAMRSTPATSAAPSHASVKRWTALDTIAHDSVADLQTYHALAGATPALVHNCDVGTQVEHGSTELSRATVIGRLLDNNRSNLYGAARMNDGTIITAHSDDAGHAEEHILSIAQSRGYSPTDITDMYTEYGMCPRCQGQGPQGGSRGVLPQLSGTVNLTYSIPFANPASRPAAKKALASIVRGIFSG